MWLCSLFLCSFFFFKQKTAYEMRISDWSSDVCSSDLGTPDVGGLRQQCAQAGSGGDRWRQPRRPRERRRSTARGGRTRAASRASDTDQWRSPRSLTRSEEHTSELQSLMRISYAVFCLKKQTTPKHKETRCHQDPETR